MQVKALHAKGYRNLDTSVEFCRPLAVLAGENNAGKSNVIDGLRTVLEPELGPRHRCWLRPEDFAHDGHGGDPLTGELELTVELEDLSDAEKARMVTCLAPQTAPDAAKVRLKARIGSDGRVVTQWFGGDSDHADVERHARSAVRFVYLHPLRDAAADLRPGRDNKLVGLIAALAPPGDADRDAIVAAAEVANQALDSIEAIVKARSHVAARLAGMTGGGRFGQQSDLAFDDPRFERVVGSLRAKIGQLAALDMSENGLGYNNLLYMAVLLAAIADRPADEEPTLRVLLVEEPEAHLHPQLQDLLMQFLESEAVADTQVVVTTHSPNFASSARVERLTVLARSGEAGPEARLPARFGLTDNQLAYLRRFLDVTKAALFFARAVILVEGVAEQLLIPVIADRVGRPLAPSGVVVINVGGVAFPPFTDLFAPDRLPYRLAVVSDGDGQPDAGELEDAPPELSPRAEDLRDRAGDNVTVHLAERTLEWDIAANGNVLPRPELPKGIGIVTGRGSAAAADLRAGLARKSWRGTIVWAHPPVQDRRAAPEVTRALQDLAAMDEVEVIVVARGGGSLADLWAFCDETLCRTVALLPVPVVSAIGHESDATLIDDVAAIACSTPTHAAESAVRIDVTQARAALGDAATRVDVRGRSAVRLRSEALRDKARAPVVALQRERGRFRQIARELRASSTRGIAKRGEVAGRVALVLSRKSAATQAHVGTERERLSRLGGGLTARGGSAERERRRRLEVLAATIRAHEPERVLERGFALVEDRSSGDPLTSAYRARTAEDIRLRFADDTVDAKIEESP